MKKVLGVVLAIAVTLVSGGLGYLAILPLISLPGWVAGNASVAALVSYLGPLAGLAAGAFWARAMLRS